MKLLFSLEELEELEAAIETFDKAVSITPNFHEAWFFRGLALEFLSQLEAAIHSYTLAIEINPEYANAFYNRACVYARLNNINPALQDLQTAINLNAEYQEFAKKTADFERLMDDDKFQSLVNGSNRT